MPALYFAILTKLGCARSKWRAGGLHHPGVFSPLWFGGQKFVAVTVIVGEPGRQCFDLKHCSAKHAPHLAPLLKSAVLNAVESIP